MWDAILQHLTQATQTPCTLDQVRSVGGGCINQGYRLTTTQGATYFLKTNSPTQTEMFAAEAAALQAFQATGTIAVPTPICWGHTDQVSYLVLEWLDIGIGGTQSWHTLGQHLAQLHRQAQSTQGFGWHRANTIGSTPQLNPWTDSWVTFWGQHRLGYQLQLGRRKGGRFPLGEKLLDRLPFLLANHHPEPSLVHGDLWSGNVGILASGKPVIFDPAAYYGDREVDLAMTELFGRFPAAFYEGYRSTWPLSPGYEKRRDLYNLYHILNHFNLFGGSYESQANALIQNLSGH